MNHCIRLLIACIILFSLAACGEEEQLPSEHLTNQSIEQGLDRNETEDQAPQQ
ncbi:MAG: hypothetical protein ACLFQR_07665 [Desulfovibrionales bacterium]